MLYMYILIEFLFFIFLLFLLTLFNTSSSFSLFMTFYLFIYLLFFIRSLFIYLFFIYFIFVCSTKKFLSFFLLQNSTPLIFAYYTIVWVGFRNFDFSLSYWILFTKFYRIAFQIYVYLWVEVSKTHQLFSRI